MSCRLAMTVSAQEYTDIVASMRRMDLIGPNDEPALTALGPVGARILGPLRVWLRTEDAGHSWWLVEHGARKVVRVVVMMVSNPASRARRAAALCQALRSSMSRRPIFWH